jgi:predicted nucleotidyltransferase
MNRKQIAIEFAESLKHPEIMKIILFDSVARGDDIDKSDIDVMIITNKESDKFKIDDDVYGRVLDNMTQYDVYISVKIIPKNHYEKYRNRSFYRNVDNDGVLIGR